MPFVDESQIEEGLLKKNVFSLSVCCLVVVSFCFLHSFVPPCRSLLPPPRSNTKVEKPYEKKGVFFLLPLVLLLPTFDS